MPDFDMWEELPLERLPPELLEQMNLFKTFYLQDLKVEAIDLHEEFPLTSLKLT